MPKGDTPGIDFESHRRAAQDEDVAFLMGRGVPLEVACERVGVSVQAYVRRMSPERSGRAPLDTWTRAPRGC